MVLENREECVWAQVRPTDVESFAQAAHSPSAQWHAAEGVTTSWAAYSNVSDEVVVLRADQGIPVALRCALLTPLHCWPRLICSDHAHQAMRCLASTLCHSAPLQVLAT